MHFPGDVGDDADEAQGPLARRRQEVLLVRGNKKGNVLAQLLLAVHAHNLTLAGEDVDLVLPGVEVGGGLYSGRKLADFCYNI